MTPRDGPAQLSRERKRVEAGGGFHQWEVETRRSSGVSTFRGELKRTSLVVFSARFLVAEVGVAGGRVGGR